MDGKYINLNQSRLTALALAFSGFALVGWGAADSLNVRYQLEPKQVEAIHQAGKNLQDVEVPIDRAAMVGNSMSKAGLGLLALMGAVLLSPDKPRKLPTIAMEDELLEVQSGEKTAPPKDEILQRIRYALAQHLQQQPWMQACLNAKFIIVCGASGAKKSRTASAIAFLRAINGDEVVILDPHAEQDYHAGTFIAGEMFGFEGESEILDQRDRVLGINPKRTQLTSPRLFTVFDEFTGWGDGSHPELCNFAIEAVTHASRSTRKQNACDLFIVHSGDGEIRKGTFGTSQMESGVLTLALNTAMVIYLETESDQFGNTKPSGKGWWKPADVPWIDSSSRKPLTLPSWFDPGFLKGEFQEWLYAAGVGLKADFGFGIDTSKRPIQIDPRIQEAVDRLVNPANLHLADTLDRLFNLSSDDLPEDGLGAKEIDWQSCPEKAKEFLQYCYSKGAKLADSYGWFEVRNLYANWGKNHDFTRPQFRDFLAEMHSRELGMFQDKSEKCWKPLISPSSL